MGLVVCAARGSGGTGIGGWGLGVGGRFVRVGLELAGAEGVRVRGEGWRVLTSVVGRVGGFFGEGFVG